MPATITTASPAALGFISQLNELAVALGFPPEARIEGRGRARSAKKGTKQATSTDTSEESVPPQETKNGATEAENNRINRKKAKKIRKEEMAGRKHYNQDGDVYVFFRGQLHWRIHRDVIYKESPVMWDMVEEAEAQLTRADPTGQGQQGNQHSRVPVRIDMDDYPTMCMLQDNNIALCMLQDVFYFMYHHEYQASHPVQNLSSDSFRWSPSDSNHVTFAFNMYILGRKLGIARLQEYALNKLSHVFGTFLRCLKSKLVAGHPDESFRSMSYVLAQAIPEAEQCAVDLTRLGGKMSKVLDTMTAGILEEDPAELDREMMAQYSTTTPSDFSTSTRERSADSGSATSEERCAAQPPQEYERVGGELEYPPAKLVAPGWCGLRRTQSVPCIEGLKYWLPETDSCKPNNALSKEV